MTTTELTKYAHACLTLSRGGRTLLLDPGVFTPEASALLGVADAVLVTHDHPDHLDVDAVTTALRARPRLRLHGPAALAASLDDDLVDRLTVVQPGERLDVAGFDVRVFGGDHAPIHQDMPPMANVGFLIEGVCHPGDSYEHPPEQVDTLLLPTSGPWTSVGQAVDFVRAVAPRRTIQIHDGMLNDVGRGSVAGFLGAEGLTGVPLLTLSSGETVSV
ncbi:MBL fold metallo-hydrolase [Nocardioides sp. CPCC 205120]|uniref:MBL fold metallo-hydrolase n=1 Tax=Nocardioides sp. CPCC 205120 TaxID=3406462 RepID=UPI003B50C35A